MSIGSLFSGIGGLELGLEWAGLGPVRWQVENGYEKGKTPEQTAKRTERNRLFLHRVLARHWPDASRFVDVRDVGAHNLQRVDIICGGFPCQDISNAGKRAGLTGARSGLWFEYARIIGELRPEFVVVENVGALLVRGIDDVCGSLAEMGYDALWLPLRASDIGAPHRRDRIFIVAYRDKKRLECERNSGQPYGRQDGHDADGRSGERDSRVAQRTGALLADPGRECVQRRPVGGGLAGEARAGEGEGLQRQRGWHTAGDGSATAAVGNASQGGVRCGSASGERGQSACAGEELERFRIRCDCGGQFVGSLDRRCPHCGRIRGGSTNDVADPDRAERGPQHLACDVQGRIGVPQGQEGPGGSGERGGHVADSDCSQWYGGSERAGEPAGNSGPADGDQEKQLANADCCRCESCEAAREGLADAQSSDRRPARSSEPRLGFAADGIPGWVVRWPARPGQHQYEWEAPRTSDKCAERALKLKALGNAVVPGCGYVVGMVVRSLMEMRRTGGLE